MTPSRAREIRIHWLTQVSPGERSYDGMIERAILAACREERVAILDDVARVVCIPHCYAAIRAIRDRERGRE